MHLKQLEVADYHLELSGYDDLSEEYQAWVEVAFDRELSEAIRAMWSVRTGVLPRDMRGTRLARFPLERAIAAHNWLFSLPDEGREEIVACVALLHGFGEV